MVKVKNKTTVKLILHCNVKERENIKAILLGLYKRSPLNLNSNIKAVIR